MISKSALALAGLVALVWAGYAFADATGITTACPTSFQCAFSAAETLSLNASSTQGAPGQPNVYIGYMAFDSSGNVTAVLMQNKNGTVTPLSLSGGICSQGSSGLPATINFPSPGPQWMFVTVNGGTSGAELDFLQTMDNSGTSSKNNAVRVGVCRSPAP